MTFCTYGGHPHPGTHTVIAVASSECFYKGTSCDAHLTKVVARARKWTQVEPVVTRVAQAVQPPLWGAA